MVTVDWSAVVKSVAANAIDSLISAPERRLILESLVFDKSQGMSFSGLKERTGMAAASLTLHLSALGRGGLVENFLERRPESKDYSFYKVTRLGVIALDEYDVFRGAIERQVALSSGRGELVGVGEPAFETLFSAYQKYYEGSRVRQITRLGWQDALPVGKRLAYAALGNLVLEEVEVSPPPIKNPGA